MSLRSRIFRTALAGFLAAVPLWVLCGCHPRSVVLSLSLHRGMTRTTRFVTDMEAKALPSGGVHVAMTYRFTVVSMEHGGVAKVAYRLLAFDSSGMPEAARGYLEVSKDRLETMYLDRAGRMVGQGGTESGAPSVSGLSLPDLGSSSVRERPDSVTSAFGGLVGRRVSVGETWTTPIGPGQKGSMSWTLESLGKVEARLSFQGVGTIDHVELPGLPSGVELSGRTELSGFVVVERGSGWPLQGKSVARVTLRGAGGQGTRTSLKVTTLFDPVAGGRGE